jgi:tetratricopeptide (TPR) repeat protein/DNA-binding beta-propeller fold protein YncE
MVLRIIAFLRIAPCRCFMRGAAIVALVLGFTSAVQAAREVSFVSEFQVANPFYITVDSNGVLYVTVRIGGSYLLGGKGSVQVFDPTGKNTLTIGGEDKNGVPYLKKPAGVAVHEGKLYVCDTSYDRIVIFSKDGRFLDSFGEHGDAAKQFKNPEGVFVYQGLIYVADTDNDRIQVFGPNGVFLRSIGDRGEGEALLKSPRAVAVDSRGMIYVVDGVARLVKKYRQDGRYAGKLTGSAKPGALAMAEDGLWVTDIENFNIVKYDLSGEKVFSFGTMGKGKVQFQEIQGIAADQTGKVYVVDRNRQSVQVIACGKGGGSDLPFHISPPTFVTWVEDLALKVRKLTWQKPSQRIFAIDDDSESLIIADRNHIEKTIKIPDTAFTDAVQDTQGFLWVIDRKGGELLKMGPDGRVLLKIGASGSREGYFSHPSDLMIGVDGLIYVADQGNDRVQVFNREGVFLAAFSKDAAGRPLGAPTALAQDRRGNLYVLCRERKVIVVLAQNGRVIGEIGGGLPEGDAFDRPVDLAVLENELLVLDAGKKTVYVFGLDGRLIQTFGAKGVGKGDFKDPVSIAALDDGRVMISDPENRRVQVLRILQTPATPEGVCAKSDMRTIDLSWNARDESFFDTYRIFRRQEDEPVYREVGRSKGPSFRDTTVLPDKKYYYRVSARSTSGNENISMEPVSAVALKYTPKAPIDLKAQSQEWSVDLSWKMEKPDYIDRYRIYRERDGDSLIAEVKTTNFTESGLDPDVSYTYLVSAVSIDGIESDPASISVRTLVAAKPPLELDILHLEDIFSNTYKLYETQGIGKVRLTNNTRNPIRTLKLSFHVKEFMDFPTDVEIRELQPKESRDVTIKAVFNNRVLDVTEDTPVQTELAASYYENQKLHSYTKSKTVNLYEKHRMTWNIKERIATFVTPKDPVIVEFTRAVVTQYADVASALVYAGAIFDYLGSLGMTYIKHPNNPYQIVEGKTSVVDYVQYPRDTLKRNSGVCTDLVVLYAAALEGLGIRTMILGTPDHLFLMFAVGTVEDLGDSTQNNMLAVHEGLLWVPVELTLVGAPFMKAWEKGSKTYYEWKKKGMEMTDLSAAWSRYKPATLPPSDWRAVIPPRSEVDRRYGDEMTRLYKIWLKFTSNHYYAVLAKNPRDAGAYLQLGIIYGEAGELEKAQSFFEKADELSPNSAEIKNNIGNLYYLKGKYDEARKYYEKAFEMDRSDPYILVNLSLCYLKLNKKDKAARIFQKAVERDGEIARKYRSLAMELF